MSRRLAATAIGALVVLGLAAAAVWQQRRGADAALQRQGQQIFEQGGSLVARLEGHASVLPVAASRCINCHNAGGATANFGPLLNAAYLTGSRPRRGGPPSQYDEAAFCRLLATGIDPAQVMLGAPMPRYEISAGDCHALWRYLVQGG